jgi:5-methylcytosine-specific restriction endonuclease McrA
VVVLTNGGRLGSPESFCFYCGRSVAPIKQISGKAPPPYARTVDHVIPQSRGGRNGRVVTACLECNHNKHNLTADEFRVLQAYRAGEVALPYYKFAAEQLPA